MRLLLHPCSFLSVIIIGSCLLLPRSVLSVFVNTCPASNENSYYYEFCASSTEIALASGNCTMAKGKMEIVDTIFCADYAEDSTLQFCHECGSKAVCSNSQDTPTVCQAAITDQSCTVSSNQETIPNVNYEISNFPCSVTNPNDYGYTVILCLDGERTTPITDDLDCRTIGYEFCHNCDSGLEICSSESKKDAACSFNSKSSGTKINVFYFSMNQQEGIVANFNVYSASVVMMIMMGLLLLFL